MSFDSACRIDHGATAQPADSSKSYVNVSKEGSPLLISHLNPDQLTRDQLTRDQLTRLVFGDQPYQGETADCLFVFGGSVADRTAKAIELHKAGKAPLMLLSGGTKFGQRNPPEAVGMREQALAAGVPDEAILLEVESNHTVENVLASLLVLHRAVGLNQIRRLIAVSAPFHMRRSTLALQTYLPHWIEVTWCADDRPHPQAHNWWESEAGVKRVESEARKIVDYVRHGFIGDAPIDF